MKMPGTLTPACKMILLIDNYDSFVHNLGRYLQRLGQPTHVVRNDMISIDQITQLAPDAIVLSPGPCGPDQSGVCKDVVRHFEATCPILGVCLGHQVIADAFGGTIVRSETPVHGRASQIIHSGDRLFTNVPTPTAVGRYHSLVVDPTFLPSSLNVTARLSDGTVMAIEHAERPIFGVQFHPESILTEHGFTLLQNFLRLGNIPLNDTAELNSELHQTPATASSVWPERPVTF